MTRVNTKLLDEVQRYLDAGMTREEIADKIEVSANTINNWIKKYNLNYTDKRFVATTENLEKCQELLNEKLTYKEIAKRLNIADSTVGMWVRMNLVSDPIQHYRRLRRIPLPTHILNKIADDLYAGKTKAQIGRELKVSHGTVYVWYNENKEYIEDRIKLKKSINDAVGRKENREL